LVFRWLANALNGQKVFNPVNERILVNLVCSHCLAVNRVPETKLQDRPICGKCRQLLLPSHPVELTDASFAKFISRTEIPILVDFWAAWCGPCRMMAPAFKEAAAMVSPRAILAKLDTDAAPQTASQFSISGIPTIILFQGGREVARHSGVMSTQQIVEFLGA
jgi:thioredoxin 2